MQKKVHINWNQPNLPNVTSHCDLFLRFHAARRDATQCNRLRRRQNGAPSDGLYK